MFTVMHRAHGIDTFYKSAKVEYIGPHAQIGPSGINLLCEPDRAGEGMSVRSFHDGTVFVMNEQGATVGRYELGLPSVTAQGGNYNVASNNN